MSDDRPIFDVIEGIMKKERMFPELQLLVNGLYHERDLLKVQADRFSKENDELKAKVEELEALIKHIYHYGTIMTVDDHRAMMNWGNK